MKAMAAKPVVSKVAPHLFEPDPDLGVEPWVPLAERGRAPRRYCLHCGLLGEPGDARHAPWALPPPPPDPVQAAQWSAHQRAILGEREDDEDG